MSLKACFPPYSSIMRQPAGQRGVPEDLPDRLCLKLQKVPCDFDAAMAGPAAISYFLLKR